jgi:DNA mismatch repair protein MutS
MLIDDYFVHQINFEKKYGKKTIVLFQAGAFFEIYGVNNKTEKIGDVQVVTELLNIQLTRRNKSIIENSRSNALMAGFPLSSLKRFINILLSNNYTVILIEQTTEPPNPKREITQIYSPGTYIEEINQSDPNNIVSLYITEDSCHKTGRILFSFGLTSIDLSTGHNTVYESNSLYYEKNAFLEEIYRFIESYNPREILVNISELNKLKIDDIKLKINNSNRVVHYQQYLDNKYFNITYQNSFLKKIFPNHGIFTPIEYIDMEKKQNSLISFIILLQFSYEHNERIIEKINKPKHWEYNDHLILYNNAIYQLNIVGTNGNKSLYNILKKTSTSMGQRLLKERMMNPITNINELTRRYSYIEMFSKCENINEIENILSEIIDIERMHRKMSIQILNPHEFLTLTYSYDNIIKLFDVINNNFDITTFINDKTIITKFKEYIEEYNSLFELMEMGKYTLAGIGGSFFKKGKYQNIDKLQSEINEINKFFEDECKKMTNIIEIGSDYVKVENTDRDGYFIYLTKKRSDILVSKFSKEDKLKYDIKKYNTSNVKISSEEITEKSIRLVELKDEIKILTKEEYLKLLTYFYNKYTNILCDVTKFIALIDVIKCSFLCAQKYQYHKPEIKDKYNGKSYFESKSIRHPIIEIINEHIDYVKNDISLIYENINGILLYGVNGSGKSSLSKAVGCNILLAQIGFYVPSDQFIFYPYKKIFTRINGDDNIFKGMSSFAVEMDELRSILKYSDDRSIVLGDEICKGTEETSALSIVSSSILRFCERNVNFIFATHFHKLYNMECMKNLQNIKFMHLSVTCNKDNETIIYGRKLEEGPGDTLYGIEIAQFIIEDPEFINCAKQIRNGILNKSKEILIDKKSNYNSKLYVDCCMICGVNGNCYPLDTHHIKEQNTFIEGDFNKDKLSNIVVLCKKHHDEVHNGNLYINGYLDTIDGGKLDYYYINNEIKKNSKKKYNENDIKIIKDLSNELKEHKDYMKILELELVKKGYKISRGIIKKILENTY